jgi:prepilin-type processing-associated H-X9-DG protein
MKRNRRCGAFTLIELLIVISIIIILASLLLPVVAGGKARSQQISCMSNLHQLQLGWRLYVDDFAVFPENRNTNMTMSPLGSWVTGYGHWGWDPTDLTRGTLFPYIQNLKVYHCPSDQAPVPPPGPPASRRNRSYSLNIYLNGESFPELAIIPKQKEVQIHRPSSVFAFIDENEASLNDGMFGIVPLPSSLWADLPADRHQKKCNASFLDGHSQSINWKQPKRFIQHFQPETNTLGLLDLRKLQQMLP